MSARYTDPTLPLPTRDTGTLIVTRDVCLGSTDPFTVQVMAGAEAIELELPSAEDYPGLDYVLAILGAGPVHVYELDEDDNRALVLSVVSEGPSAYLESDGEHWCVAGGRQATDVVPAVRIAEMRVWDVEQGKYRQALSLQDASEAIHSLVAEIVEHIKEQGEDVSLSLEEFHVATRR